MGVVQEAPLRSILNHPHPRTPPRRGEGREQPYAALSFLAFSWASSIVPTM